MRNDLISSLRGSAADIPLAFRKGWLGPVLQAQLSEIDGRRAALLSQQAEITLSIETLVAEMRDQGTRFGLQVFGDRLKELQDVATTSPEIMDDLPVVLRHFQPGAAVIVEVHIKASAGRGSTAPAFAHMQAARATYGEHVLRLAFDILAKLAGDLGLAQVPAEWADGIGEAVPALVFPGDGDAPKDDAWRQDFTVRFNAIRDQAQKRREASGRS